MVVVVSQFNGTSTPKGSYSAKTGDNDCNINSSCYSLRTALCESIRYQAKSEVVLVCCGGTMTSF